MNTHVTFVTEAFEMETPKENFINPCCFGEDCANWLADRLKERGFEVDEVFQEDWGWCFAVTNNGCKFWIDVGLIMEEKTWLVVCESNLGLFKSCSATLIKKHKHSYATPLMMRSKPLLTSATSNGTQRKTGCVERMNGQTRPIDLNANSNRQTWCYR